VNLDRLNRWLTLAANIGVIAGILFLAYELQQNQLIASSENILSYQSIRNDVLSSINEHPEIWKKGNEGAPLSQVEAVIYENLVDSYGDAYFFNYFQWRLRGEEYFAETAAAEFAYFLVRNPGAYPIWEELERRTGTSIDALVGADRRSGEGIGFGFNQTVRSGVVRLRELENSQD